MTTEATGEPAPLVPLRRQRDYVLWWVGDTGSALGVGLQSFALPLVAAAVTGSVTTGGALASISLVATVATGLPGGVLVDRFDRRRLLWVYALSGVAIWATFAALVATHTASWWAMAILAALGGVRAGLFGSLTNACLKSVVPTPQVPHAVAANQGRDAAIALLASPVSGLLLGVSLAAPFIAGAVLAASTLLPAVGVRTSLAPERDDVGAGPWKLLREGVGCVARSSLLRGVVSVAILINLGLNGLLMTAMFRLLVSGIPGWQLGLIEAAVGAGMILGAVAAPGLARRVRAGIIVTVGLSAVALIGALLAAPPPVAGIAAVLAVIGFGVAPINAVLGGVVTTVVPGQLLGRVSAVLNTGAMALGSAAPLIAGWGLAQNAAQATAIGFVTLLALGAVLGLLTAPLRSLPSAEGWSAVEWR